MKKTLLTIVLLVFSCSLLFSQDQIINGSLRVGAYSGALDSMGEGARLYLSGVRENSDPIWLARYNTGSDASELRVVVGDNYGASGDKFSVGAIRYEDLLYHSVMVVTASGRVGINTEQPQSTLAVNGTITAKQVKITAQGWPDYVFAPAYRLRPLQEVADSIECYKHLPGMPSEKQLMTGGLDVAEMSKMQQEKIEELTLYLIQQDKTQQQMQHAIALQKQQQLQHKAQLEARLQKLEEKQKLLINMIKHID
jgi:hypothetical protein